MSKKAVAFIDCSTRHYSSLFKLTAPGKSKYCSRRGFDFIHFDFDLKDRTQHWGRVMGIRKHLDDYEWLIYLDTDSLISNQDFEVLSLINQHQQAMILTGPMPHEGHIGTNGMIFRNCRWVKDFLDEWYSMTEFIDSPYYGTFSRGTHDDGGFDAPPEKWKFYEQSAFHYLYDTNEEVRSNTVLLPRRYLHGVLSTHKCGDFTIHFPGMSMDKKIKALRHHVSLRTL